MPPRTTSELQSPLSRTKSRLRIGPPRDRAAERSTLDALGRLFGSGADVHAVQAAVGGNEHGVPVQPEQVGVIGCSQQHGMLRGCLAVVAHADPRDSALRV